MEAIFLKILNMSITATWLCLAVMLVRLLLKRAPRAITCVLWVLVAVRLLLPFSFESAFSLIPTAEPIPGISVETSDGTAAGESGDVQTQTDGSFAPSVTPTVPGTSPVPSVPENPNAPEAPTVTNPSGAEIQAPSEQTMHVLSVLWLCGILLMLLYMLVSYLHVRRRVRESVPLSGNVRLCDGISSPFLLGVVRPRIYLPSDLQEKDAEYVIAHETAHLCRGDHLWKPIGFLLLAVHWFNPILWIGYILLCRDIELACDERVIRLLGAEQKRSYSEALVNCSAPRRMISACPLAFGEIGVKERIRSVLNYKKPTFWIIAAAVAVLIVTAVCFLTDPITDAGGGETTEETEETAKGEPSDSTADTGGKDTVGETTDDVTSGNEPPEYLSEIRVNIVGGDNAYLIHEDSALNADAIKSDPRGRAPIHRLDSASEMWTYLLLDPEPGVISNPKIEMVGAYRDAYFERNSLLVIPIIASSGSFRYTVDSVVIKDGACTVSITEHVPPVGTDDVICWLVVVEIPKEMLSGVTEYDALVSVRIPTVSSADQSLSIGFFFNNVYSFTAHLTGSIPLHGSWYRENDFVYLSGSFSTDGSCEGDLYELAFRIDYGKKQIIFDKALSEEGPLAGMIPDGTVFSVTPLRHGHPYGKLESEVKLFS